jgi:hypothetical protein
MKGVYIIGGLILAAGAYIEYQKDSSFASVDAGSMLIGGGLGFIVGSFF